MPGLEALPRRSAVRSSTSQLASRAPDPAEGLKILNAIVQDMEADAAWLRDRVRAVEEANQKKDRLLERRDAALERRDATLERRDAALERRDATLDHRDAVIAAKDADLARLNSELQALGITYGEVSAEHERIKALLRETTTNYLAEQGKLDMRGVLEYVERAEEVQLEIPVALEREKKWEIILSRRQELARCLLRKNPTRKKPKQPVHVRAASLMSDLYSVASIPLHPIDGPEDVHADGPIVLSNRSAAARQADMVACICEHSFLDFDRVGMNGSHIRSYRTNAVGLPPLDEESGVESL